VILALAALGLISTATAVWQVIRARQQLRWREETEARMAAMQERHAQSNGHPRSGQVQHLGRHH
jgi:post-segregation antitoxin (ccd killing protein)